MLTVSNYHYIRESFEAPYPSIFGLTPHEFEKQLLVLMNLGEFIHPLELIKNIDKVLNSKQHFILITFDDGLKEQFELAKPILDKLGIPALFFINSINYIEKEVTLVHKIHLVRSQISPTELLDLFAEFDSYNNVKLSNVEKQKAIFHYNYDTIESAYFKYILNFKLSLDLQANFINQIFDCHFDTNKIVENLYMTDNQVKELGKIGMLGSHTHSHIALGLIDSDLINDELTKTKDFLKQLTQSDIVCISYPYGSKEACAKPVPELAYKSGYKIGFTMDRGINRGVENKLLLKRFDCNDLPLGKNEKVFKNEFSSIYK